MTHSTDSLTRVLREQQRSSECPAPEQFLPDEWAALAPDVQRTIAVHVADCAICQAERDMAHAFVDADATGTDELERQRIARVQAAVDARMQQTAQPPPVRSTRPYVAVAAVVVLGVAVMFAVLGPQRAQWPEPVMRGANVVLVAPVTDQAAPVNEFAWHPVQGAASYVLTVNEPSGATVYTEPSESPTLTLPKTQSDWQRPGTTYHWRVDAYDGSGVLVGTSGDGRFRISPATED